MVPLLPLLALSLIKYVLEINVYNSEKKVTCAILLQENKHIEIVKIKHF